MITPMVEAWRRAQGEPPARRRALHLRAHPSRRAFLYFDLFELSSRSLRGPRCVAWAALPACSAPVCRSLSGVTYAGRPHHLPRRWLSREYSRLRLRHRLVLQNNRRSAEYCGNRRSRAGDSNTKFIVRKLSGVENDQKSCLAIINTSLLVVLFKKRRLYSNVNHSDPNWKKSTRVRQS